MTRLIAIANSSAQPAPDAWRAFHPFTLAHALVLAACAAITIVMLWTGLQWRGTRHSRPFEKALGMVGLAIWVLANGYGLLPHVFAWEASLPLHVCDLCALAGPIVLLVESPPVWLRAWLYFAGFGLCTQAFITPAVREGPAHPVFWAFWSGHLVILICVLYDLIVRRWRPTWRAWRTTMALSIAYLAVIFPLDAALGWNYGYLGNVSKTDTLLGYLGPWPWRVAVIVALTFAGFAALMVPWRERRAPMPSG